MTPAEPAALAAIWAAMPIPVLVIGQDGAILSANPAAELFFNVSARSLQGAPLGDRLVTDTPLDEAFARALESRASLFINDVSTGTAEREPAPCNIQIAPLNEPEASVLLLISPREIAGRLGRAMSAKSAAKSAIGMAEMLAHEIKNPLAGISGAAQLLSMNLSAEDRELTDLIVAETRRVVKLLEQVEQFGNLRPPECRAVNLHDVLDRARRATLLGFGSHMRITEDFDPSLPDAWADPDQLVQVFQNLLRNASEAAGARAGTIQLRSFYDHSLRLRKADGSGAALPLQVEIIDDGPGLPPHIAAEVFEPFVSGRENGTGLGLALVSKIIADHDGWIAVESRPGRTVFRVSLPVAKPRKEPH